MTFEEELFDKYASDGWSGDAWAVGPDSFRTALMKYKNYLREIPEAVPAEGLHGTRDRLSEAHSPDFRWNSLGHGKCSALPFA